MIILPFNRESVSMGDDAGSGEYTIEMPNTATLGDLINVIMHGGNGNDWPIPYTGANSFWVIRSDVGDLADIYTDEEGEWIIRYLTYDENAPLESLGITWIFGAFGLDPTDKRSVYNGYEVADMTGKEIKEYLSEAYSKTDPYHGQTAGEKLLIQRYKKLQDDTIYLVFYNDSFMKIYDTDKEKTLYFITYTKEKPDRYEL